MKIARVTFIVYKLKLYGQEALNGRVWFRRSGTAIARTPKSQTNLVLEIPDAQSHIEVWLSSHPATADALDFKLFVGDDPRCRKP